MAKERLGTCWLRSGHHNDALSNELLEEGFISIGWSVIPDLHSVGGDRDDVRAKLRSSIKRLLVRFGYPPDKQPEAIKLVMEQMESMAPRFVEVQR